MVPSSNLHTASGHRSTARDQVFALQTCHAPYHDFGCKRDTQVRGGLYTSANVGSGTKIGVELRFRCPKRLGRQGLGRFRAIQVASVHNLKFPVAVCFNCNDEHTSPGCTRRHQNRDLRQGSMLGQYSIKVSRLRCEIIHHGHVFMCV
jgi:hypothetical protein